MGTTPRPEMVGNLGRNPILLSHRLSFREASANGNPFRQELFSKILNIVPHLLFQRLHALPCARFASSSVRLANPDSARIAFAKSPLSASSCPRCSLFIVALDLSTRR